MSWLDWLKPAPPIDAAQRALITRAVAAVDPLLKTLPGFERTLAPAVTSAFNYCQELAARIPGPVPINRGAFASEPLVHALFGSADDIEIMLGRSQCLRGEALRDLSLHPESSCALLGVRRHEKTGFGARLSGEIIRYDEPQTTLYFSDHTLAAPSPDSDTARRHLTDLLYDGLLKGFVAHLSEVRAERQQLRDEHLLATTFGSGIEAHTRRLDELAARLRATSDALLPQNLLQTLRDYLSAPRVLLRLEPVQVAVDRAGVIVNSPDKTGPTDTLRFLELTARDQRRWVVVIAQFDPVEALSAIDRLDEARRHIIL